MQEEQFIPFIHNYCDRWCEQCRFIMRCRVGVEEVERLHQENSEPGDVYGSVVQNLKKALEMLERFAEENGIDWQELQQEINDTDTPEPSYPPEQDQLKEWGKDYIVLGQQWFSQNEVEIKFKEKELNQNMQFGLEGTAKSAAELVNAMEVIRWFLFFISVKMDRAIHGLNSDWLKDEPDPVQNDANGSAKVALDAIERSLVAWEIVRKHFPESTDELIDVFVLLKRMQKSLVKLFPNVNDFVRPGFDQPEFYSS